MTTVLLSSSSSSSSRTSSSSLPFRIFVQMLFLMTTCTTMTEATKHSFDIQNAPTLIGPVGVPFGFLDTGYYSLTVYNFKLTVRHPDENIDQDLSELMNGVEAGFYLKKFPTEAHFNTYYEELKTNHSACSFEYFLDRDEDRLPIDNDVYFDSNPQTGPIPNAKHGILLKFKGSDSGTTPEEGISIEYDFQRGEAGLYFLMYQVCSRYGYESIRNIRSSFDLDFHFMNYDNFGNATYLTAGEMRLPLLFFFFSISYLICFIVWVVNNRLIAQGTSGLFEDGTMGSRPIVYPIHHLMSTLLLFKFFATFFESLRYHFIRIFGHADFWTVAYMIFTFIKGTFLFVVIMLIGTGWSFVKPFLNDREKKVILVILCLQVANNIALIVLSHLTEGETTFDRWTAVLHLVDILCCCAVLLPIVWQVNMLERSIGEDGSEEEQDPLANTSYTEDDEIDEREASSNGGTARGGTKVTNGNHMDEIEESVLEYGEKGQILSKLKLFRSFYLLVVAYIYSTRILVYLFATMLSYRYTWVRYFVVEVITLTFYVTVGMWFRPMSENPYLSIKKFESSNNNHTGRTSTTVEMTNRRVD